jgi:hypothetical protein
MLSLVDSQYYCKHLGSCFILGLNFAGMLFFDSKYIGVVSRAGIYDGEYPIFAAEKGGNVIAAKISFA